MFSVLIKSGDHAMYVEASKLSFFDNPVPKEGGFAGGMLSVHWPDGVNSEKYDHGTAYVMNDKGRTIATYYLSEPDAKVENNAPKTVEARKSKQHPTKNYS